MVVDPRCSLPIEQGRPAPEMLSFTLDVTSWWIEVSSCSGSQRRLEDLPYVGPNEILE